MPHTASPMHSESRDHRISISLSASQHSKLASIAQMNDVSIAWVVREAVERLLSGSTPTLRRKIGR
jgi:hypothetical protein